MNTNVFLKILLPLLFIPLAVVAEDAPFTLDEISIPKEEARQQALFDVHEYRYSYLFKKPPMDTLLFAECFVDGKLARRFILVSASHWELDKYARGSISIGWFPATRELVTINDNGLNNPGYWTKRINLSPEILTKVSHVLYSPIPIAEKRTNQDFSPPQEIIVYPIIALVGSQHGPVACQTAIRTLTTTKELLRLAASERAPERVKQCVVIYMYISQGGNPPLHFDNLLTQ